MPTLSSPRHHDLQLSETGPVSDRDHMALDLASTSTNSQTVTVPGMPSPLHSQTVTLPGMPSTLEAQTLRHEASLGRLAEGPAPTVAPAVAAAMATSYFSELGLDDVPQVRSH